MRSRAIRLCAPVLLFLLAVGCAGSRSPDSTPASAPPAALPAPAAPSATPTTPATPAAAPKDLDGIRAQCAAGGAKACFRLCEAEAAVCDDKDSKDECKDKRNEKAESVDSCAVTGFEVGKLCKLEAKEISPTQAAVGMFAVECKAKAIADRKTKNLRRYLLDRPVPMVVGPAGQSYITDRHHTSTGVLKAEIDPDRQQLFMCPMADRSGSEQEAFWSYMVANNFAWLFDREGEPIDFRALPPKLGDIEDDPYRTLSRWVRDSCGYIKCGKVCGGDGADTRELARCQNCPVSAFFLEFHWANYLREVIEIDGIYDVDLDKQGDELRRALPQAMTDAAGAEALDRGLPGWNDGLIQIKLVTFEDGCDQ